MLNTPNQNPSVELILDPILQGVTVNDPTPTISVLWDKVAQQAVSNAIVGPTIADRVYSMVHTSMFDAWAAYDPTAIATQLKDQLQRPQAENTEANKKEAMSFAAYRTLKDLFPSQVSIFDELMGKLGFNPNDTTTDTTKAAGIGNVSAEALLKFRREDGSNQLGNNPKGVLGVPYSDITGYKPVNSPGNVINIERWTPETIPIDALPGQGRVQQVLGANWSGVTSFSLESNKQFRPPAPQPFLLVDGQVNLQAKTITLKNGQVLPITKDLIGTVINPKFIAQAEKVVNVSANLTDKQKLIAEFWEDQIGSSFPAGSWMTFGQYVSARDNHTLDDDAKLFFTLGNGVFDAGVATWEAKRFYDYARPVRVIRSLGELGLIGEFNKELGGYAIEAWKPGQGTQTILATDFVAYQLPGSNPSPPFQEYTSGHSGFSGAGSTILELFTDSDYFGGNVTFQPGLSRFEPGITPEKAVTLRWDTFSEAAIEAGDSRIYGGIHFDEGNLNGQIVGQKVGLSVWEQAQFFIEGGKEQKILFGTKNSDRLVGTNADEKIYARSGNDSVIGGLGNDQIFGGDGNDRLWGDGGDDVIRGGLGSDRIWGGGGDDILRGGLGSDRISGNKGRDTFVVAAGEGTDTIIDFHLGKDLLGLADGLKFGELSIYSRGNRTLIGFEDQTLAILDGVRHDLTSADFIVI
ncbi:hypothetical protein ANSO36C_62840 (plasmid) [Nostoc cf. commune SO-36]|uniref:Cyclic nucleotide-binding domain-containing protein n=1 Tax=Nostoc cf. commune SO-36 TaxID=449208 RepID=A0ABM7ZB38_NOSCO|nr:hypothetical protein [Nostoc commune]BDI20482.1 hypothetical protein ANSO36C_62840 [Nostoc cf. commune SO-36]